jgi:hypothetical protein
MMFIVEGLVFIAVALLLVYVVSKAIDFLNGD